MSESNGSGGASFVGERGPRPGAAGNGAGRPTGAGRHDGRLVSTVPETPERLGATATRAPRPAWERRYAWTVIGSDLLALTLSLSLGMWMGPGDNATTPYTSRWMALVIFVGFVVAIVACRAWDSRILGSGSEEYSRLTRAVLNSSVTLGMAALAFQVASVRPWVFLIIPLAGFLALCGRYALRKPLHRRRLHGSCLRPVLAVGDRDFIADLVERTRRDMHYGWWVSAACTPGGLETSVAGVPVVGDLDSVSRVALSGDYGVIAVAPAEGWTPLRLHRLSWDIEGCGAELVVHPGLMEISGPRLHVTPVDGLPLLRLTEPTFTGIPRLVKTGMDVIGAFLLIMLLTPLFVAAYLAVRSDGGPGLFRQTRVGRDGQHFRMIKFRTMVTDAERLRCRLAEDNEGSGPLFKMRSDPRVTPVGVVLRRYSIDELPQLFNVLLGSMSLVGPRPPLPDEVASYARDAQRKLLVKPGLTGLWQISGRSDLSWDESVRLDLRYVENWSLALDALILWKTVKAVIHGDGAY